MSKNTCLSLSMQPTTPRPAYAVQMAPVVDALVDFASGRKYTHVSISVDLTGNAPEWSKEPMTYTRKQVVDHLVRMDAVVRADPKPVSYGDTTAPKSAADLKKHLALTHEVTSGVNKGQTRPLFVHAIGAVRGSAKRARRAEVAEADLVAAMSVGKGFFARGVVDAEGNHKPFATEDLARKAWLRANHPLKGDWWTAPELDGLKGSERKAAWRGMVPANAVFGQDDAFRAVPDTYTAAQIAAMHHSEARRIAAEMGAGEDVTKGKGAAERCRQFILGRSGDARQAHAENVTAPAIVTAPAPESMSKDALIALIASMLQQG